MSIFRCAKDRPPGKDVTGAVCAFLILKPENFVFPCLIFRWSEKSYVLPFASSTPNTSDELWMANTTSAPGVKFATAGTADSTRTVKANLGSKSTGIIFQMLSGEMLKRLAIQGRPSEPLLRYGRHTHRRSEFYRHGMPCPSLLPCFPQPAGG